MTTEGVYRRFEVETECEGTAQIESVFDEEGEAVRRAEFLAKRGRFDRVCVRDRDAGGRLILERVRVPESESADDWPLCSDETAVFRYPARRALARVFRTWCDVEGRTPIEILHDPRALDRLLADAERFGAALERLAAAQARAHAMSADERRAALSALARRLRDRAGRADELEVWFRLLSDEGIASLIERARDLLPRDEVDTAVTYALARRLARAGDWTARIDSLCDAFDGAGDHAGAVAALDEAIAETLDGAVPLRTVLGMTTEPAAAVSALAQLGKGALEERFCRSLCLLRLNSLINRHGLPATRAVILRHVVGMLEGRAALTRKGKAAEAAAFRVILDALRETGGLLGGPAVALAVTRRARRALAPGDADLGLEDAAGAVTECLPDPSGRIGFLLDLLAARPSGVRAAALVRHLATIFATLTTVREFFGRTIDGWTEQAVRESFRRRLYAGGIRKDVADLFLLRLEQLARERPEASEAGAPRDPAGDLEDVQTICYQIQALTRVTDVKGPHLLLLYKGQEIICGPGTTDFVIGRSRDCDLSVAARTASRRHATIRNRQGDFLLIDRSRNGTYVRIGVNKPIVIRNAGLALTGTGFIHLGGDPGSIDADHVIVFQRIG